MNGVPQTGGRPTTSSSARRSSSRARSQRERPLGFWRWARMALGIAGSYRQERHDRRRLHRRRPARRSPSLRRARSRPEPRPALSCRRYPFRDGNTRAQPPRGAGLHALPGRRVRGAPAPLPSSATASGRTRRWPRRATGTTTRSRPGSCCSLALAFGAVPRAARARCRRRRRRAPPPLLRDARRGSRGCSCSRPTRCRSCSRVCSPPVIRPGFDRRLRPRRLVGRAAVRPGRLDRGRAPEARRGRRRGRDPRLVRSPSTGIRRFCGLSP